MHAPKAKNAIRNTLIPVEIVDVLQVHIKGGTSGFAFTTKNDTPWNTNPVLMRHLRGMLELDGHLHMFRHTLVDEWRQNIICQPGLRGFMPYTLPGAELHTTASDLWSRACTTKSCAVSAAVIFFRATSHRWIDKGAVPEPIAQEIPGSQNSFLDR
ncbi:MAG TPA: hypothetical protein VLA42_00640 [Verrucomicrobiae bacterium]|nr:hypothetical protein [Verrucomicrobiae bacterium]